MSEIVRFLEAMGKQSALRHATSSMLYDALSGTTLAQRAQWSILRGDRKALANIAGARDMMRCILAMPEPGDADGVVQQVRVLVG